MGENRAGREIRSSIWAGELGAILNTKLSEDFTVKLTFEKRQRCK